MGKRGPKPGTVTKPAGSGRVKGQPNHATLEVKSLARKYGEDAIHTLATLMIGADSDQAKIAAARELLDRGYGKATQPLSGDDDAPAIKVINELVLRGVRSDPRD